MDSATAEACQNALVSECYVVQLVGDVLSIKSSKEPQPLLLHISAGPDQTGLVLLCPGQIKALETLFESTQVALEAAMSRAARRCGKYWGGISLNEDE